MSANPTRAPHSGAWRAPVVVAIVGTIGTAVAASAATMTLADTAKLVVVAAGAASLGAVGAWAALRFLRGRSVGTQIVALTAGTLTAVAIGAWAGARYMFLSAHDLSVLVVVLWATGSVGLVSALVLGDRIGRANTSLIDAARRIGDGEPSAAAPATRMAVETARLAAELDATSLRLDEARRRERAVESSRRELVAWMSHDLRTPLSGLLAIAEALEDGVVADDAGHYYALMRQETERLATLVDDLFELSRTQAGVLCLEMHQISLTDVVSDAIAGIAPIAQAKGVRLEGRSEAGHTACDASPAELLRALRNVLENAVHHTPSDGSVIVEIAIEGSDAVVHVLDDGGGIAAEDIERVFDAGFRGDAARRMAAGGGLGLAIAKGIVEAHRGEIAIRNENGGARFTIRLPLESEVR
jgi:signal transduction histidine kinase